MSEWKPIDTAPLHEPVLVEVDGMICFGRFCEFEDEDYSGKAFDGCCINDGEPVSYIGGCINGWKPVSASVEMGETADQMFSNLGYKKVKDDFSGVTYKEEKGVSVITYGAERNIFTCFMYNKAYGFTPEEMAACVQLAKERYAL